MPREFTLEEKAARRRDVAEAVRMRHSYQWLAGKWGISRIGAFTWCRDNISNDTRQRMREDSLSRQRVNPNLDTRLRLELIELCEHNCWTHNEIAAAIGCTAGNLSLWIKANAPDGIEDALSDFREDPPNQAARAA